MTVQRVDHVDRYAVELPEAMDAIRFCSLVLESAPRWLEVLLSVRDTVVGRFGFTTQERNHGNAVELAPGRKFGPLLVKSVTPQRVLCGSADAHLTVEASFETDARRHRGSLTTTVQFNDRVGCAYFAVVKPFHRRLVPVLIARPFPSRATPEPVPGPGAP